MRIPSACVSRSPKPTKISKGVFAVVPIPEKLRKLQPYEPVAEICPVRLDANESFLDLPVPLREKAVRAVAMVEFNRYPDPLAAGVCRAFADFEGIAPESVTAGDGSDELISLLFNTFVPRGGRVLIPEPDFSMYRIYCALAECEPILLPKDDCLQLTADEIIAAAWEEKPDLVIFSNPCNPTGQGLPRSEILRIVDSLPCLVVVDEAYMDFWTEPVLADAPGRGNLIVLRTCSKMGLAALRLGFAVTNRELTELLRAAKSPYNVNALTQAAGEAVLAEKTFLRGAISQIVASRDSIAVTLRKLEKEFGGIRVLDSRANFAAVLTPDASRIHAALREAGVSVRCFTEYNLLRITTGSEAENRLLLGALRGILKQMQ